ncbi:MAG: type I secretion system permease/ATPase, partial [Gammaproteobacteria bacterium]|nr:type I secretion system permease/ATPase [Gammaproteobacteria bacterium]
APPQQQPEARVGGEQLKGRERPDIVSRQLASISSGSRVPVYVERDGWAKLSAPGEIAWWVDSRFLKDPEQLAESAGGARSNPNNYRVNSKALTVREGPDAETGWVGNLLQGTEVDVYRIEDEWALISPPGLSPKWVNTSFLSKVNQSKVEEESAPLVSSQEQTTTETVVMEAAPSVSGELYLITSRTLNIRSAPEPTASWLGALKQGDEVNVFELKDGWARISGGDALREKWISRDYIEAIEQSPEEEIGPNLEGVASDEKTPLAPNDMTQREEPVTETTAQTHETDNEQVADEGGADVPAAADEFPSLAPTLEMVSVEPVIDEGFPPPEKVIAEDQVEGSDAQLMQQSTVVIGGGEEELQANFSAETNEAIEQQSSVDRFVVPLAAILLLLSLILGGRWLTRRINNRGSRYERAEATQSSAAKRVEQVESSVPGRKKAVASDQSKHGPLRYDPLLESLTLFAKLYHRPVSTEALIAGLPVPPGQPGPELFSVGKSSGLFSRVAKQAGFSSRLTTCDLDSFTPLLLPCILVLKDRQSCILEELDHENGRAKIILAEVDGGEEWLDLETLKEQHLGYAFLLKKEYQYQSRQMKLIDSRESHWFWGTLARSKGIYGTVILASVMVNIFILASPLFIRNVYDRVVPNDAVETLWVLAVGVAVVYFFDTILRSIRFYLTEVAGRKSDVIMSSIIYEQVMNLRMDQWPGQVGAFANRLREFETVRSFFTASTLILLIDLPFALLFLLVVYLIGDLLVLVPIVIIVILLAYTFFINFRLAKAVESAFEAGSNKNSLLVESLNSIQTIRTTGSSHHFQWLWEEASGEIAEKSMRTRLLTSSVQVVTNLLTQLNRVAIIVAGVYMIMERDLSSGALIAVMLISTRAISPMGQVANLATQYQRARAAYNSLNELMALEIERPKDKRFVHRKRLEGAIRLEDVDFIYPGAERETLKRIDISIEPGEHVAILGKVGSGKTTISKLLIGLYGATRGTISIDGIDIEQIDPVDLRFNTSYLSQDIELIRGTVRDNILLKNPGADDEQLLKAATVAGVDQFVNRLSMGYDTMIGERGAGLSGGQRQCIALARSILQDENILILDEPTNSMDNATEALVRQRLVEYTQDKTLILITHKLSILELVERIIVIEQGEVSMDGPKQEILEKLGVSKNGN